MTLGVQSQCRVVKLSGNRLPCAGMNRFAKRLEMFGLHFFRTRAARIIRQPKTIGAECRMNCNDFAQHISRRVEAAPQISRRGHAAFRINSAYWFAVAPLPPPPN